MSKEKLKKENDLFIKQLTTLIYELEALIVRDKTTRKKLSYYKKRTFIRRCKMLKLHLKTVKKELLYAYQDLKSRYD